MVIIILKFSTGEMSKITMPDYKSVLAALCGADKEIYHEWIRNDKIYDPSRGFLVTDMKLDASLKVTQIELTEQRFRGFNE